MQRVFGNSGGSDHMTDKRQMTIFDFLDPAEEKTEETKVDMSCFATRRSGKHGIKLGECAYPEVRCNREGCDAFELFYDKAEEYHNSGEPWNVSVALAKEFFKIPTVPEYSVEYYRRRNKGAKH